jgi:hypothetical protein
MRLKVGPLHSAPQPRTIKTATSPASSPATPSQTVANPVKADLAIRFQTLDLGSDPLSITLAVPAYNPALFNTLIGLSVIAVPFGSGKPADAPGWLNSTHPKASAGVDPVLALAPVVPVASPPVAAADVPPADPTAAAVVAPATVTAPAVVAPIVETVPASTFPGPTGGLVTVLIPNVPNGQYEFQVIENYAD